MLSPMLLLNFALVALASVATITRPPELRPRQTGADTGSTSCDSYTSVNAACAASTPGFLNLGPGQQYSCLCFTQSTWAPSIFDGYLSGCLSYLKTASTAFYSSIGGDDLPTDYCLAVSSEVATETSTSSSGGASTSLTAPLASYSAACNSWEGLITSCAMATPSFTNLQFSSQASCLCGSSSSTYLYDQLWQSCLQYEQVADPEEWSKLGGSNAATTPCAAAAGQLGNATALVTPSVTTTASSGTHSLVSTSPTSSLSSSSKSSSGACLIVRESTMYMLIIGLIIANC